MDKKKILIVDDEYGFCKRLKSFFEGQGYVAIFTTNGEHAIDLARDEKPDIAVLDVRMPGMDGNEVLAKIKKERDIPAIILTAVDAADIENRFIKAGAQAVLKKPADLKALLETVKNLLN